MLLKPKICISSLIPENSLNWVKRQHNEKFGTLFSKNEMWSFSDIRNMVFPDSRTPKTKCADKKVQKRLLFATEYMLIKPKGSPFLHFSVLCDIFEEKNSLLLFLSLRYGADFRRSRLVPDSVTPKTNCANKKVQKRLVAERKTIKRSFPRRICHSPIEKFRSFL